MHWKFNNYYRQLQDSMDDRTESVLLHDIHTRLGDNHLLIGISLSTGTTDVISVLRSSGSGTSTLLRCVASACLKSRTAPASMSRQRMIRPIILPSAFRRALPACSNEVMFMLHGRSLASVITIIDITGAARIINPGLYSPYAAFLTAFLFSAAITFFIVFPLKKPETG